MGVEVSASAPKWVVALVVRQPIVEKTIRGELLRPFLKEFPDFKLVHPT